MSLIPHATARNCPTAGLRHNKPSGQSAAARGRIDVTKLLIGEAMSEGDTGNPVVRWPARPFGRAKLPVTVLGLGGAPIGNQFGEVSEADAVETLEQAWNCGIRYFDVSPLYGFGLAEHRFGQVLRMCNRDDFLLSTKVGRLLTPSPHGRGDRSNFKNTLAFDHIFDYGYDGIMRSFEDSLQRLGLARVDVLYVHDCPDEEAFRLATGDGFRALSGLREQGVISSIGVGVNDLDLARRFIEAADFDCFMIASYVAYTLLTPEAHDEFLPLCQQRDISVVVGGVMASGILATGATPNAVFRNKQAEPDVLTKVALMERVCASHGISLTAAALQFPLAQPTIKTVLAGARSAEQMRSNVTNISAPIPDGFWSDLKNEGLLRSDLPVPTRFGLASGAS